MFKKINFALIIFLSINFSGCSYLKQLSTKVKKEIEIKNVKEEIRKWKEGCDYVGEGYQKIEKRDISKAIEKAKEKARQDLATTIKSTIRVIIIDELGKSAEKSYEIFESKTKTYTEMVLGKPDKEEHFLNFPDEDSVTYLMCVSEKTLQKWVKEDIEAKLKPIAGYLNSVLKNLRRKSFVSALPELIEAKKRADNSFGGMPVEIIVKDDRVYPLKEGVEGEKTELYSFISTTITEFIGNIRIELIEPDKKFTYATDGRINKTPKVYVSYFDETGRTPISRFPLKAAFIRGNGRLVENPRTGEDGIADINIEWIDPSNSETTIKVSIDYERLGIKEGDVITSPGILIPLTKLQTVAVFVNINAPDFIDRLKEILRDAGYDVVISDSSDVVKVREELHADNLLTVEIKRSATGPDAFGLYTGYVSGNARMFLTSGKELFTISCPTVREEHISRDGAVSAALSRFQTSCIKEIENRIKAPQR